MKPAARLMLACVFLSLSSCGIQVRGLPHIVWWPHGNGEEVYGVVPVPRDGTVFKRGVSYWVTPNRSGATRATAVRVLAAHTIDGEMAEWHVILTRFPDTLWRTQFKDDSVDFKTLFHTYHVYQVPTTDGKTHEFWFDASDYDSFYDMGPRPRPGRSLRGAQPWTGRLPNTAVTH